MSISVVSSPSLPSLRIADTVILPFLGVIVGNKKGRPLTRISPSSVIGSKRASSSSQGSSRRAGTHQL